MLHNTSKSALSRHSGLITKSGNYLQASLSMSLNHDPSLCNLFRIESAFAFAVVHNGKFHYRNVFMEPLKIGR
jgi:hypothetical protein